MTPVPGPLIISQGYDLHAQAIVEGYVDAPERPRPAAQSHVEGRRVEG